MLFFLAFCKPVIKITGNKRIESDMIKSHIPDNALTDDEILNKTLKDLYETGHFKDITPKFIILRDSLKERFTRLLELY